MTIDEFNALKLKKGSKYGNRKTEYNGIMYDSKKEADYARHLESLKHAHEISDRVVRIERQVPFRVMLKQKYICTYFADFVVHYGDARSETIDVKGMKTAVYNLKKKLVEAQYDIVIREV